MSSSHYSAPDFKRRQLLFDSFSKLQQKSISDGGNTSISLNNNVTNPILNSSSSSPNISSSSVYFTYKQNQSSKSAFVTEEERNKGTLLYSWGAGYHGQLGL